MWGAKNAENLVKSQAVAWGRECKLDAVVVGDQFPVTTLLSFRP